MKVMCIDDNYVIVEGVEPKFGEVVTVSGQCETFKDCWIIAEYPLCIEGRPQSFYKYHFAPLSDIEETELVKERESELCLN